MAGDLRAPRACHGLLSKREVNSWDRTSVRSSGTRPSKMTAGSLSAWRFAEDLGRLYDWTTVALVPEGARASAVVRARRSGVIAGIPAAKLALAEYDAELNWTAAITDGTAVEAGTTIGTINGLARNLLTAERTALNLLGAAVGDRDAHACLRYGHRRNKSADLRHAENDAGLATFRKIRRARRRRA